MHVLLIDIPTYSVRLPEPHRTILDRRWRMQRHLWEARVERKLLRPSLAYSRGMLLLAAHLEASHFRVSYLNYTDPADRVRLESAVREADAVCLMVLTPTAVLVRDLCSWARGENKQALILIGGPHVSALPMRTLSECRDADFALTGDSHVSLPLLLDSPEAPDAVHGVYYRDADGTIRQSSAHTVEQDSSELMPAYHLLGRPLSQYAHNVMTVRGCPFNCSFCADRATRSRIGISERPVASVLDELTILSRNLPAGTLVHFSDAVFTHDWERVEELIRRLKASDIELLYSFDTRPDLIDSRLAGALQDAGFIYFRLGFESLQDGVLARTGKGIRHLEILQASQTIREAAPRAAILGYMVAGLPGSTAASMREEAGEIARLISEGVADVIGNKILVPYPGTLYFEDPEGSGINMRTMDWSLYDRNSMPVYDLASLGAEEIYEGFLIQETALVHAYGRIMGDTVQLEAVGGPIDYAHANYTGMLV